MRNPINSSEVDTSFFNDLNNEENINKLLLCINCNGCSTGCPMTNIVSEFNIKKYLRMAGLGLKDKIINDKYLWYCTTCYKCQERCPEEIHNVDVLLKLRTIAVSEGIMLPQHKDIASNVIKTGHAVPLNDDNKNKRKILGLSEIPPTVHTFNEELKKLQKLINECKFDKLISYTHEK